MDGNIGSLSDTPGGVASSAKPRILIGVTSAQTCLIMKGRLRALKDAGFDVTLVSAPGEHLDRIGRLEGVRVRAIPMKRQISLIRDLFSFLHLWRVLKVHKPAVVEFSTPKAGLLGLLAAWIARVPRRIYLLRGLKCETASGLKRVVLRKAEKASARFAHAVLCTSESVRQAAISMDIAPSGKLAVLGRGSSVGVDIKLFSPGQSSIREKFCIPASARIIGFVGRLTCDKGIPELLACFEAILLCDPSVVLLLVGWFDAAEDALPQEIRQKILSHPRIVSTGFVHDTVPFYRAMEVLVLPTRREGFPNTILEASAVGVPVVATTATGARDAVLHGVTGLLVAPGDVNQMCESVLRLLENRSLRRDMGIAGRNWVSQHFASEKVLAVNAQFFKSQLEPHDRGPDVHTHY